MTDWLTQKVFISDISSQKHPLPITLWWVILIFKILFKLLIYYFIIIFNLCFQQEIMFWLIHHIRNIVYVSSMFDSNRFTRCFSFWFVNSLKYLPVQFSSRLLLWWQHLAVRAVLCLYFQIKCSSFLCKFCVLIFVQLILSVMYIYRLITV